MVDKINKAIPANYKGKIKENLILVVLVAVIIFLSIASPYFLQVGNLMDVAKQAAINGIIALGMTFVITTGGIDLSVGSVWALSGVVTALLLKAGHLSQRWRR